MPTGYTAQIGEGETFEEFILACARNFGACITMRDAPNSEEIPEEFKPTDYHAKRIKEAEKELNKLKKTTPKQAEKGADEEYKEEMQSHEESIRRHGELEGKYRAMLASVMAWNPPTPDHKGLKDFMESQIIESIKWDCNTDYEEEHAPKRKTGKKWLDEGIKSCLHDLSYHTKEHQKEVERCASRTSWVRELRNSIKKGLHND